MNNQELEHAIEQAFSMARKTTYTEAIQKDAYAQFVALLAVQLDRAKQAVKA